MAHHTFSTPSLRPKGSTRWLVFDRAVFVLVRRLIGPLVLFLVFILACVLAYMWLEGMRLPDALFWVAHPHAIDYLHVGTATKYFSLLVAIGIFAFEIWLAERILLTFVGHQGREVWKSMINEMNSYDIRDHFIICGYGQVAPSSSN
jgi:hypothetical protein